MNNSVRRTGSRHGRCFILLRTSTVTILKPRSDVRSLKLLLIAQFQVNSYQLAYFAADVCCCVVLSVFWTWVIGSR
jgi:hypothetical protein